MIYLYAFLLGGALCAVGQLLIDFTKLTPARILTAYVVTGVVLGGTGVYTFLRDKAGCGASVPLTGFGDLMAEGVRSEIENKGFLGIFTGGLTAGAGGIAAAMLFAFIASLIFKSRGDSR